MLFRLETVNEQKLISAYSVRVIQEIINDYEGNEPLVVHAFITEKDIIPHKSWDVKSFEQWTKYMLQ